MSIQSQRFRVLHIIDSLAPGGAERMLVELVNSFDFDVVTPYVCVTRLNLTLKGSINPDITVYCLNRKSTWDWGAIRSFGKIIKEEKIQIIHAHGYSSFRFACAAQVLLGFPVKIIVHAHSSDSPDFFTSIIGRIRLDFFIGTSTNTIRWAKEKIHLSENKVLLLENAINPNPYLNVKPKTFSHLFRNKPIQIGVLIANIRPIKDFLTLFQALALSKHKDHIGILIAGSIANNDYFIRCKKELVYLALQDQVIFLGYCDDIPQLLASVDFGVLSSERETGPVALLEYIAAGVPFVVTRVGQVAIEAAKAGIPGCVPIKNPHAFSEALDALIEHPPKERNLRVEQGYKLLKNKFNIHHQIQILQTVYQKIIFS